MATFKQQFHAIDERLSGLQVRVLENEPWTTFRWSLGGRGQVHFFDELRTTVV